MPQLILVSQGWFSLAHKHKPTDADAVRCCMSAYCYVLVINRLYTGFLGGISYVTRSIPTNTILDGMLLSKV